MNFRLTLTMVVVLLLVLIAYVGITSHQQNAKPEDEATKNLLLSPAPKEIKTIAYAQDGDKQVAFEKDGAGWNLTFPATGPANTYEVDPIADGLKTLSYKEKFDPEATGVHSPASTGIDKPRHLITFTDDSAKEHTLALGKATIGGIYATFDGGKTIYLLANNPLDSLQQDPNTFRNKTIKETSAEKIGGIQIKHPNQTVSLTKSGDKWLLDAPISARANHTTAEEIINEMKNIHALNFSDLAKTMPATGLNPPVLSVTAVVEEPTISATTVPASQPATVTKTPITLELGYYTDLTNKNAVYASLAGSKDVFTISADTFKKLDRQLKDLRDPAITPAPVANATQISINSIDLKKQDAQWQITSLPHPVLAGTSEVNAFLTDIANLRAINFVDNAGDLKSIGLDPPQTTLSITIPSQSQKETILIGKPEAADKVTPIMRQGEPTVYLVQTDEIAKLTPTVLALRDKNLDKLSADSIRSISVAGSTALTLQRDGSIWNVTQNGKTEKADELKMTPLLGDFTPITANKYLAQNDQTQWHLPAKPDLTVTILSTESTTPATTSPTSLPASLKPTAAGPNPTRTITHTLNLYKENNTWKAVWEGGTQPQWLFEPTSALLAHLTSTTYAVPATQPATTQPSPEPAAP